jgi:hypothetical protein
MAKIGLKYGVFAPIETETPGQLPTYGAGLVVGRMMRADLAVQYSDSKLAADDTIVETDRSFISGTLTVGVDDLSDEVLEKWLGLKSVEVGGQTVLRSAGNYIPPNGGFGYIRVVRKNGVPKFKAYWIYKSMWVMPNETATTKPNGAVEWQTPTVEGTIMTINDTDATWRDEAIFATETEAVAWLNELANIGEPADLTALDAAIDAAKLLEPEDYTSASWVAVAVALADAEAVMLMDSPSQTRVDAAENALTGAMANLVEALVEA